MKRKHNVYLKTVVVLFLITIVMGVIPFHGNAQLPPTYVIIDYMKVEEGKDADYLSVEKDIWKPIHQERINQDEILGWILYRVRYTGTNDEYNYATATIFASQEKLDEPLQGIDPAKVLQGVNVDEAMEKTLMSRKRVKSQLIIRAAYAYPENSAGPAPHKYLEVNFMKVPPASGYLALARNLWQPIQMEHVRSGSLAGWTFWSLTYPRGLGQDYQYAAVNYYSDNSKIGTQNLSEAFNKAHPGKDMNEELKKSREARTLFRSELWEVLDMVMKEQ